MSIDDVWKLEERLWLDGAQSYDRLLDEQCLMAFPSPVGLLQGDDIARSLEGAPRWTDVAMSQRKQCRPDLDTVTIGYRAKGRRSGSPVYAAYCTSTYRRRAGAWKLIQHQQSPD